MNAFTVQLFEEAEAFRDALRLSNPRWDMGDGGSWLFRGVGNSAFGLVPTAWRQPIQEQLEPLRDRVAKRLEAGGLMNYMAQLANSSGMVMELLEEFGLKGGMREIGQRLRDAKVQARLEEQLLRQFYELADRACIELPNTEEVLADLDADLPRHVPLCDFYRGHNAAHIAQHHGVPTRLLDWTRRPETAAFFAAKSCEDDAEAISVWAMNRKDLVHERWNRDEPCIHIIERPSFHDGFIASQEAAFTTILRADKWYVRKGEWPSIEALWDRACAPRDGLVRMDLQREQLGRLLDLLKKDGYFEPRIFPSLDHMANAMRRLRWLGGFP